MRILHDQAGEWAGPGRQGQVDLDAVRCPRRPVDEAEMDYADADFRVEHVEDAVEHVGIERAAAAGR